MNIYKTTKYPRSKQRAEGVDRAWLLSQLPNAKYPNALLSLALHSTPPWTVAACARITEDVLLDFVFGRESLSACEIHAIGFALGDNRETVDASYITDEEMAYISDDELDEYLQGARDAYSHMDKKHPVRKLLPELFKMRPLPCDVAFAPCYIVERTPEEIEWNRRAKPRGQGGRTRVA